MRLVACLNVSLRAEASLDQSNHARHSFSDASLTNSCQGKQRSSKAGHAAQKVRHSQQALFCAWLRHIWHVLKRPQMCPTRISILGAHHLILSIVQCVTIFPMLQWRTSDVICISRTTQIPTGSLHTGLWWEDLLTSQGSHTRTGGSITHSWSQR